MPTEEVGGVPHNLHNFYNESTSITNSKHLHNVLGTLQAVQQCFKLNYFYNCFYVYPVNSIGSHNVYCAPIVPFTGKCWPWDGLEETETCSHTRVLMIVCLFIQIRSAVLRLIVRSWLGVPTFATRRLHACHHVRAPSGGRWNYGREMSGNFA